MRVGPIANRLNLDKRLYCTSLTPGLTLALMMWHKSGGPSSRKVPFVA
jgi:hypothetical protein